jgi:antitoxin component HigA of HigAB toxin-antitoxin module
MLALQTITTVSPIRSDAELAQAHARLDELILTQAYNSPNQELRDEFEVLTALIYYYEQRTSNPNEFAA